MHRPTAADFDQELLDLYDEYVHGKVTRRDFLDRASRFAAGGLTAAALLEVLGPNYAWAQQVPKDDPRIRTEYAEYASPKGAGTMRGYLARPAELAAKQPGILVIHENRGLNPYIEDVTRRLAVAGFIAFAPDALTPLGGYPGNDDAGRELQRQRKPEEMTEDFIAGALWLQKHPDVNGIVGVTGFCYGGGMSNTLAVRLPEVIKAAVPFYGGQPKDEDVPKIQAPLLLQYAEKDERVNAGWPAYESALKAHGKKYEAYIYPGTNHGFHNDTTPRYDENAAKLAETRMIEFFNRTLRS
jgi:carboxymethylenebutenolidase